MGKHPVKGALLLATLALTGCATQPISDNTPASPSAAVSQETQSPEPAPTVTSAVAPAPIVGWPQTFTAPKLGVTAPIVGACATGKDGAVEPPADIHAGCATGRLDVDPGGAGTTVLTGHTTRAATTGAFEQIYKLTPGDTFTVGGHVWHVVEIGVYQATGLPERLFMVGGPRQLILGTCHLDAAVEAGAPYTQTDLVVGVP